MDFGGTKKKGMPMPPEKRGTMCKTSYLRIRKRPVCTILRQLVFFLTRIPFKLIFKHFNDEHLLFFFSSSFSFLICLI